MAGPRFVGAIMMTWVDYPLVTIWSVAEKFHTRSQRFSIGWKSAKKSPGV
jgi:hypothetical protein